MITTEKRKLNSLQIVLTIAIAVVAIAKTVLLPLIPTDAPASMTVKIVAAILLVMFALSGKQIRKNTFNTFIFVALICDLAADILIKYTPIVSVTLFGVGHLILVILFIKKKRPSKIGLLIWILVSVVIGVAIFLFLHGIVPKGYLGCAGATLYASVLVLMVVAAVNMPKKLRLASYAFIVSDLLLVPDMISPKFIWCHCISTMLFYLSLWLFSYYLITEESST